MADDITLRILDLFAGRGTASNPFRDRGWEVTRVEIVPEYRPEILADIAHWKPRYDPGHFDFIWASPPCRVFSNASGGRHFKRENPRRARWYPGQSNILDRRGHLVEDSKSGLQETDKSVSSGQIDLDKQNRPAADNLERPIVDVLDRTTESVNPSQVPHTESVGLGVSMGVNVTDYRFWRSRITVGEVYPVTSDAVSGVDMVEAALASIVYLEPDYWAVENPVSLLRSILGPPAVTTTYCSWGHPFLKPTDLWGDLPLGIDWNSRMCLRGSTAHKSIRVDLNYSIDRAAVPYQLGWALAEAIEFLLLDESLLRNPRPSKSLETRCDGSR